MALEGRLIYRARGGTRQLERDVDLRSHVAALHEIAQIQPPDSPLKANIRICSTRLSATPLSANFLFLLTPDRLAVCLCPTISLLSAEDDQSIQLATPRGRLDSRLCSSIATEDALPTRVSKCVRAVRAGRPASRWHTERGLWTVERPIR